MPRRSDQDAAADALYARIPDVGCKGLCAPSCTGIDASYRERARIREHTGITLPPRAQMTKQGIRDCPALTEEGRCGAYEVRPGLCRIWGASEAIPCRWGCTPSDGQPLLSAGETYRLLAAVLDAGGGSPDRAHPTPQQIDEIIADHGEEAFTRLARQYITSAEEDDYIESQPISAALAGDALLERSTRHVGVSGPRDVRTYPGQGATAPNRRRQKSRNSPPEITEGED